MACIQAAAGCRDLQSVPSTGVRWQWQQVFPTKPSQVQSHCVLLVSHLLLLLSEPLKPSCPSAAGGRELARYFLLGTACRGSPWALQRRIPILGLSLFQSATPQPSVQVTDGWRVRGRVLGPESPGAGDVTSCSWGDHGRQAFPSSVSCLLMLLSVRPLGFPCPDVEHPLLSLSSPLEPTIH